jgi:hypothetical protein
VEDVEELASILGCRVSLLPMKYLGLPLGASSKAISIWNGIIKKMECLLAGWKKLYLSKGGKLILVKITYSRITCLFSLSQWEWPLCLRDCRGIF